MLRDRGAEEVAKIRGSHRTTEPEKAVLGQRILITLLGNVFPPGVALITAPILASGLGVDGRGAVAAAVAPLVLLTTLGAFGIPETVTYGIARATGVARRITTIGLILSGSVGVAFAFVVVRFASWLSGDVTSIARLIVLASLALAPSLCLGVVRATASGLNLWALVAVERFVTSVVRLLAIGLLAILDDLTPVTATIALAFSPLVGGAVYIQLVSLSRRAVHLRRAPDSMFMLSGYAARVWMGSMAGILLVRLDQTIMLPLTDAYQLGLYVVAVSIAELPLIINSAVRDVSFATEASSQSTARLTAAARISSSVCAIACAFTAVVVPLTIPALFGSAYSAAVPATLVLLCAVVVVTQGSVIAAGLSGRGHPGLRSATLSVACGVNVVLVIVMVPEYGALGAAWATVAGNVVFTVGSLIWMKRLYHVPYVECFGLRRADWGLVKGFVARAH